MKTKIKLDGYTLPERVKAKMVLTLFRTHRAKKELGFTLCSKPDNIIVTGEDLTGTSDRIVIDSRMCKKDEKFLGGYHTHYMEDSHASAEDLRYCGILKIICTGGSNDNKIRCNTWQHEQQSVEKHNKMIYDIDKGIAKSENPMYQPNFDCIHTMGSLFSDEKYIKEKDKDLKKKELNLLALKKTGVPEHEIKEAETDLFDDAIKRDIFANILKKEIENESKKYYNEIEIK